MTSRWAAAGAGVLLAGCGIVVFEDDRGADGAGGGTTANGVTVATTTIGSTATTGAGGGGGRGGEGGGGGAGGDEPAIEAPYAAGTRLAPRVVEGDGGARVFVDFWDRELATPCTFEPTVDAGPPRCVPIGRGAFFADPACSEPVVRVEECAEPDLATRFEGRACGAVAVEVFVPTGEVVEGVPFERRADGTCASLNLDPGLLARAERMPLDALVAGAPSDPVVDGGLTAHLVRGEDGSHVVTWLGRDAIACDPADLGDGPRCLDRVMASTSLDLYADPSCADGGVVVHVQDTCVPTPRLARESTPTDGGCDSELVVRALGEQLTEVWIDVGQGCAPFAPPGYTFAREGAPIGPDVLPRVDPVLVGDGRLTATAWGRAPHGLWSSELVFEDDELGTRCSLGVTVGDGMRCVPETNLAGQVSGYADPACTEPLLRVLTPPSPGCAPPPAARYLPRYAEEGCGTLAVTEVWERSEASEQLTVFHLGNDGSCAEGGSSEVYRVIAIHPTSALAPLAVVVLDE